MSKSNYLEDALIDWLRGVAFPAAPANIFVSLHTGDPGETGANEHGGTAGYARVDVDLTDANPAANAAEVAFPQATADYSAPVTHFGIWDAAAAGTGNFLGGSALTTARTITAGVTPRFAAGALTWTED